YIPWNLHEPERGKFDFSGNLDLEAFVLMAAEVGLWVILRPGPYICAEIDLGGLPSWLLQDPVSQLRTTDQRFIEAVDKYFDHLIPKMLPLQYSWGGPVIAVQVENEYGSFNKDEHYMPHLHQTLLERGIMEMLLTSDSEKDVLKGHVKGALATVNLRNLHNGAFRQLHTVQENKPILVMEYWVGWFDTWGNAHHTKSVRDYDALLTEAGDYTEKYFSLQKLFERVSANPLPPLPALTPKAVYPSVRLSLYLPLWDVLQHLNEPVRSNIPVSMENLPINSGSGQSYGFILYESTICSGGRLYIHVEDVAQVFLNETLIGDLDGNIRHLNFPKFRDCQLLRILVENQGRVNFSWKMQSQRKGITGHVSVDNVFLDSFTIYSLEMKMSFFERLRSATWRPVPGSYQGPAFYRGVLRAGSSPKDTFLNLPGWTSGFVFINGRNLGRYWNIRPQKTLYLPGAWLHPEDNEIILFEKVLGGSLIESTDKPWL
ncbi:PREDICTED: beta-galactosidase-1-like protein 3, partial [Galeopterus variegatus]|uniref:Beta-galactosidase-1-like protein 3 n=1 Tax=Galeopterus variegatus TaxID=482537 RepID=A0ABM0PYT2_GALVR